MMSCIPFVVSKTYYRTLPLNGLFSVGSLVLSRVEPCDILVPIKELLIEFGYPQISISI